MNKRFPIDLDGRSLVKALLIALGLNMLCTAWLSNPFLVVLGYVSMPAFLLAIIVSQICADRRIRWKSMVILGLVIFTPTVCMGFFLVSVLGGGEEQFPTMLVYTIWFCLAVAAYFVAVVNMVNYLCVIPVKK